MSTNWILYWKPCHTGIFKINIELGELNQSQLALHKFSQKSGKLSFSMLLPSVIQHTPHPIHTGSEPPQGSKQLSCCGLLFCFLRFFFSFFSKWLNTKIRWCYMLVAQTIKRILRCIKFSDSSFVFEWKFFPYHYLPFLLHFLKYRSEFSTNLMHLRICIWSGLYWQCHWTFTGTALNYKYNASWSM